MDSMIYLEVLLDSGSHEEQKEMFSSMEKAAYSSLLSFHPLPSSYAQGEEVVDNDFCRHRAH